MPFISNGRLEAVVQGLDNQSRLLDHRFEKIVQGMDNQSQLLDSKLTQLIEGIKNQSALLNNKLGALIEAQSPGRPLAHSNGALHAEALEDIDQQPTAQLRDGDDIAPPQSPVPELTAPAPRRSGPKPTPFGDLREYADIFAHVTP